MSIHDYLNNLIVSKKGSALTKVFSTIAAVASLMACVVAVLSFFSIYPKDMHRSSDIEQNSVITLQEMLDTIENLKNDRHNENFIKICQGIAESKIKDRDDLFSVYSNRLENEYGSFSSFLESYSVWLMFTNSVTTDGGHEITNDTIIEIKNFVKSILHNESEDMLFDGISPDDKSSLMIINNIIKDSANSAVIKLELNNLANSMKEKEERYREEKIMNRAALIVSILGIIATILFSLSTNITIKKYMSKNNNP